MSSAFDHLAFTRSRLVRHSSEREGAEISGRGDPAAGIVLVSGDRIVLRSGPSPTSVLARVAPWEGEVFLGKLDARPIFATELSPECFAAYPQPDFAIRDLRAIAAEALLPADELGLVATAKSLLAWHARHSFCANCGAPTRVAAGGFRRECAACRAHHFPRTDPVAIMLVKRGECCLLGRSPHHREGMFSCLAGFIEPGETIEDAVRRETFEETGIVVGPVRYHASQPWPFPASLMIGCVAEALSDVVTIDPAELEQARWFTRDELVSMFEDRHPDGLSVPPPLAIAHLLLRDFADGLI